MYPLEAARIRVNSRAAAESSASLQNVRKRSRRSRLCGQASHKLPALRENHISAARGDGVKQQSNKNPGIRRRRTLRPRPLKSEGRTLGSGFSVSCACGRRTSVKYVERAFEASPFCGAALARSWKLNRSRLAILQVLGAQLMITVPGWTLYTSNASSRRALPVRYATLQPADVDGAHASAAWTTLARGKPCLAFGRIPRDPAM